MRGCVMPHCRAALAGVQPLCFRIAVIWRTRSTRARRLAVSGECRQSHPKRERTWPASSSASLLKLLESLLRQVQIAPGRGPRLLLEGMENIDRVHQARRADPALPPSELGVACPLRASLPEFLQDTALPRKLRILLRRYREPHNAPHCNDCGLETAA